MGEKEKREKESEGREGDLQVEAGAVLVIEQQHAALRLVCRRRRRFIELHHQPAVLLLVDGVDDFALHPAQLAHRLLRLREGILGREHEDLRHLVVLVDRVDARSEPCLALNRHRRLLNQLAPSVVVGVRAQLAFELAGLFDVL